MQVLTRGRTSSGKARSCHPRFAWATTPTRLAKTPGHLGSKALARRFPWSCHERRRHRFPQDLGITGPVPEGSVPCPQSHGHARNAGIALTARQPRERASGTTYPLSAGAVGDMTSAWHRNIRWQAGRSWGRVRP
jgi:hypothetical protein